jgi:hypothetical protein
MAVRTWVGRFTVVNGRAEEEGPWLGSHIRQRPDDEPDELHILIEPAIMGREEYASQLVDVVARLYQRDPLSLTGALVRSLRAAHEHLREWNQKSLPEHRVGAGASCLALRGTDAYLAQTGPSLAYSRTADGAFRRLAPARRSFDDALGIADPFEPQLTRLALAPGDLVLVASSALGEIVPDAHVERILGLGADDALRELYLLCRDRPDFSLVLLSCFEQESTPPDYLTHDGAGRAPETPLDDVGLDDPAIGDMVEAPEREDAREPALASLAVGAFDLPRRPVAEQVREITASTAPPPATGMRLRGDDATPRYKRSTGAGIVPRFRVPKLAAFGVIVLVALGLVAWWTIPGSVRENREQRFSTLLDDARAANARAQATDDAGAKREMLATAQAKLVDATKIHPDNGEVTALKSDVANALSALDNVFEIKDFTTVADLSQQVTGGLSITRSVVGGDSAYFLDARGHRVLRLALDGKTPPETILQEGKLAGMATAGRPAQIAWSDATSSLLVLDDKRQAFAYFPSKGTLPITVRGADGWGSADAVAASGGNLYVLDVKANQVWRYFPGEGGFDSERTDLLDPADLSSATEIAVGQDLYVLDARSGIRRFAGKKEAAFTLAGIDTPLVSPASLSVLPGSSRIVVADRGNKRVVIASAQGVFLQQIVSPEFTDLRAVSIDEGKGIIYILNGDALLTAPFKP